jgi:transposase
MEDVLDVYTRPYDPARPVVCVDEASKQLLSTPRGDIAPKPSQVARQDYEYQRHGTANLFMSVEPLRGWRKVRVTDRRTASDFAEQLRVLVEEDYPDAEKVVIVTDNLNTHKTACLYERFEPEHARCIARKLEWHYTPEHGSWLNMAECELSVLSRQCLNRRIPDRETLQAQTAAWQEQRNIRTVRINWQFKTEDARIKLKRLYPKFESQETG